MFDSSPVQGAFRHGEILSDVIQLHIQIANWNPESEETPLELTHHSYCIVLTQDCDLDVRVR